MPKRLLSRFQPDSIVEFRAAAMQRSLDALALETGGRRSGAIYLWGYVAEMTLKAAFFEASGVDRFEAIPLKKLREGLATLPGVDGRQLHHLGLWAQALVRLRGTVPSLLYPDPAFGSVVIAKAQALYGLWRETIRYHKNVAYSHELSRARGAAEWLFLHSPRL